MPPPPTIFSLAQLGALCPSSHFLTPCQRKVLIPEMPWEEWSCVLSRCYVILDPIALCSVVPHRCHICAAWHPPSQRLHRLATLTHIPTLSCVRRPLPSGSKPKSREVNQPPSIWQ